MRRAEQPIVDPPTLRPGYFFRVKHAGLMCPRVIVEIRRGKPGSAFTYRVAEETAVLRHDSDVPGLITGLAWKASTWLDEKLGSGAKSDEVQPFEGDHDA